MKLDIGSYNLGWIAGFFEGEAHFGTTSKSPKRKYYCRISVSQVQRQPLEFVMKLAGGHINGPRPNGNGQPIHQWRLEGSKAKALMNILRPHMSPKRRAQIDAALHRTAPLT